MSDFKEPPIFAEPDRLAAELETLRAQVAALTAERDAVKVRVKPLEWFVGLYDQTYADDGFGGKWFVSHHDGRSKAQHMLGGGCVETIGMDVPAEAMQKVIESLCAARILAALEPAPVSDESLIRAAIEAAAVEAERHGVYPELNVWGGGPDWYKHGKSIAARIRALATPEGIAAIMERAKG